MGHVVCPSIVSGSVYLIDDINLCRIGGVTGVTVRWICSGFPQSLASISQPFSPRIFAVSITRSASVTVPTRFGSGGAVGTLFSSHVRPSSVNIFVSAIFSACGARVVSVYHTFNCSIHSTSLDPALYFRSALKSLCYSVNDVRCLSSKVK